MPVQINQPLLGGFNLETIAKPVVYNQKTVTKRISANKRVVNAIAELNVKFGGTTVAGSTYDNFYDLHRRLKQVKKFVKANNPSLKNNNEIFSVVNGLLGRSNRITKSHTSYLKLTERIGDELPRDVVNKMKIGITGCKIGPQKEKGICLSNAHRLLAVNNQYGKEVCKIVANKIYHNSQKFGYLKMRLLMPSWIEEANLQVNSSMQSF